MTQEPSWWIINVSGYGSFAVFDTEENAEKIRAHKANWEQGVAQKRKADRRKDEDKFLIASAIFPGNIK